MATPMTPLERFTMAARMEIPDQVSFVPFITGHFVSWFAGLAEGEYWSAVDAKLKAQLAVQERWPDLMLYPGIFVDYSVAVEPSALGAPVRFPPNASPQVEPFLRTPEDVSRLEPPDPHKAGLMPKALETISYMLEHCPRQWIDRYGYLAGAGASLGPTDIAGLSRGYDKFAEDIYKRPHLVHHLMNIATETVIRYLHAQEEVGGRLKRYQVADDAIGFLSRKHFVEFSLPYLQRIFREFSYAIGILHCDTNTTHLLDVLPDVGMQVFNFDSHMDVVAVKNKIGDRVCLLGNIAPLGVLLTGTAPQVRAECERIVNAAKPGGGFVLTMGSGTARGTPSENIDAVRAAVAEYGTYV